ncbi:MAG: hypothetical protein GX640_14185 [Fibrobacter sp.]|nr:hypothetical protein [Fibrobacter sp.]
MSSKVAKAGWHDNAFTIHLAPLVGARCSLKARSGECFPDKYRLKGENCLNY